MAALAAALAALTCLLSSTAPTRADAGGAKLPPIRHVFVIMIEDQPASSTFGPSSAAPYLAQTLTGQGAFVSGYYAVTHYSLGNYLALISGQGPTPDMQADCSYYTDWSGSSVLDANGQALGNGCVYPSSVQTIADQLVANGMTWKAYLEDMGNDLARDTSATCAHPALNASDHTESAEAGDQYADRHNPFVYFHSIIDSPQCAANDLPLSRLAGDLASARTTANLTFITPNLCDDSHDTPCVSGEAGGMATTDAWLKQWVPVITSSEAFKQDGMLLVTFDESDDADVSACCNQAQFPNTANNGGPVAVGQGGGRTGAVVLSPYVRGGTVTQTPYNHFSALRSLETIFGLPLLGYAASPDPGTFGSDIFTAPVPAAPTATPAKGTGQVVVSWAAPAGLNAATTRYTLQHKDANDPAWSTVASGISATSYTFGSSAPEAEGTWAYRVIATDGTTTTGASAASNAVVVDRTPPNAPSFKPNRTPDYTGDGNWWKGSVTLSVVPNGDPTLPDGSPGTGINPAGTTAPFTISHTGPTLVDGWAEDNTGNWKKQTMTVQVDAVPPGLWWNTTCGQTLRKGQAAYANWGASDANVGIAGAYFGNIPYDTTTTGNKTLTITVADKVSNKTTISCAYSVR